MILIKINTDKYMIIKRVFIATISQSGLQKSIALLTMVHILDKTNIIVINKLTKYISLLLNLYESSVFKSIRYAQCGYD